jgi:Na+/H+-dicarboxylate symporter
LLKLLVDAWLIVDLPGQVFKGIPVDGLIIIVGLDRILGVFRTAENVTGDLMACLIFDKYYGVGGKVVDDSVPA